MKWTTDFQSSLSDSFRLARAGKERGCIVITTSGFPRMVRNGDEIYFAWTQPGKPLTIRTAVLKLDGQ